jgi:repressor LexA
MSKLTKRQQEILTLIESHMVATGSPPTRAEIAKTMGFRSPNAAEDHLRALARKGVIELVPGTSRGIRLARTAIGIPIVNIDRIMPMQPVLSDPHITTTCKLDRLFFKPSIEYLLHYSLKEIPELNIAKGDYLAIHQTQDVSAGQIVLMRVNQEMSICRYVPEAHQNFVVEGTVVGVIRSLTSSTLLS